MDDFTPADVDVVLNDPSLKRVADQLRALIRPCVRLHMRLAEEGEELPLGGTRFGGLPDLPVGTVWPTAHLDIPPASESFRAADKHSRFLSEGGTFSLPFVAQIRLSEFSRYDDEKRLPASGLLYFFYNEGGFTTDTGELKHGTTTIDGNVFSFAIYGYDDPAIWHVLYVPDEASPLKRTAHPSNIPDSQQYKTSVPAAVLTELTLPHVETCFVGNPDDKSGMVTLTAEEWQAYAELYSETQINPVHQMLGHSNDSQPFAMEGSFRRIRSVFFPELPPWDSLSEAEQQQEYTSCRLLLQIDAHENKMWFGRGGTLFFFIREADLTVGDFSRVWATAQ